MSMRMKKIFYCMNDKLVRQDVDVSIYMVKAGALNGCQANLLRLYVENTPKEQE